MIGRQSFNLGNMSDAYLALRCLLIYESQQPPSQQASHLREFLAVFKVVFCFLVCHTKIRLELFALLASETDHVFSCEENLCGVCVVHKRVHSSIFTLTKSNLIAVIPNCHSTKE